MRTLGKAALALGLLAFVAGPAAAQFFQRGGPGGPTSILTLLQNKSVQEELKVSEEDVKKVPEAIMEALGKVLKPEQLKRLKQIEMQQRGTRAFSDAKVQTALKLTDEQKEQIDTIQKDAAKEMREMFGGGGGGGGRGRRGGNFQEIREKMNKLNKETMKKIGSVLKADQKKIWKEMVGDAFEIKYEQRGGGRRPRT
jgi:hypothetical protein